MPRIVHDCEDPLFIAVCCAMTAGSFDVVNIFLGEWAVMALSGASFLLCLLCVAAVVKGACEHHMEEH